MAEAIPIVDLFAGPGGLGEGFSSLRTPGGHPVFKVALSIEMDAAAHRTLELRSFFRQFTDATVPDEYYLHLQGQLSRDELFEEYPIQSSKAKSEAWNAELGKVDPSEVDRRITSALGGAPLWALCGGPPCQAYSVIGRSRNGGIRAKDHRVYLYREYLRILAVHRPPLFILENVKGLLSSKVGSNGIFKQMMTDLCQPLFLAAVRIRLDPSGMSLPTLIEDARTFLGEDPVAQHMLNVKLIHAGYLDAVSEHYKRTFAHVSTKVFRVGGGFPRFTRASVPAQVIAVRYELEIDGIEAGPVAVRDALDQLGVM